MNGTSGLDQFQQPIAFFSSPPEPFSARGFAGGFVKDGTPALSLRLTPGWPWHVVACRGSAWGTTLPRGQLLYLLYSCTYDWTKKNQVLGSEMQLRCLETTDI